MTEPFTSLETYQKADEIMRIFRSAVREARAESRRLGVANVFSIDGQTYYELPNGEIIRDQPAQETNGESNTGD